MKLINVEERNAKELARLKKAVAEVVKNATCNTGEVNWHDHGGGLHSVTVENDGTLGMDYLADPFHKSEFLKSYYVEEVGGEYMWDIELYIRPSTFIEFSF